MEYKNFIVEFFSTPDEEELAQQEMMRREDVTKMIKDEDFFEEHGDLDDITRYINFRQKILDKNKAKDLIRLMKANYEEFYILRSHLQEYLDRIDTDEIRKREDKLDKIDFDKILGIEK